MKKKTFWNNSLFHLNKKSESFKEVLHSSAFCLRWFSHYLKLINFRAIILLADLFLWFPNNIIVLLYYYISVIYLNVREKGTDCKITVRWSINIFHFCYQWKLFRPNVSIFKWKSCQLTILISFAWIDFHRKFS